MRISTRSLVVTGALVLASAHGRSVMAEQQGVPAGPGPGVTAARQHDVPAGAPEAPAAPPETYGTSALTISPVNSFGFVPFDPATQYGGDGTNGRYTVSGGTCYEAPVQLPSGALLVGLGMDWCDNDNVNFLTASLFVCTGGSCTVPLALDTSGLSNGCYVSTTMGGGVEVNNNGITYTAQVCTGGLGSTLKFRTARAFYKLQVSPAPGSATFADVPTSHPFFRFIEALAASGITGGCGGGNFCPDNALTRGQMAVFLAGALGLHFPN